MASQPKHDVKAGGSGILSAFLRDPKNTGAIAPSSRGLADAMLAPIRFDQQPCIVELGPGTGSFTREILRRMHSGTKLVALETNPALYQRLSREFGEGWFANRSAAELRQVLDERAMPNAHAIVSGLPWAAFDGDTQNSILEQAVGCLAGDGVFLTFAYVHAMVLPAAQGFRRLLTSKFSTVGRSRIVWGNLPPAFVYICRK